MACFFKAFSPLIDVVMPKVFSNYDALAKAFPKVVELGKEARHSRALKVYFENRGFLKVSDGSGSGEFPDVVYPDKGKLEELLKEVEQKKAKLSLELFNWRKKYYTAKNEDLLLHVKKLANSSYWKHVAKNVVDAEYRKDFEKANMQTTFAAHEKWNKMFNMFVDNSEYRKRLVETIDSSIVYSKEKALGQSSEKLKDFVIKTSSGKIKECTERIEKAREHVWALKELKSLVRE